MSNYVSVNEDNFYDVLDSDKKFAVLFDGVVMQADYSVNSKVFKLSDGYQCTQKEMFCEVSNGYAYVIDLTDMSAGEIENIFDMDEETFERYYERGL